MDFNKNTLTRTERAVYSLRELYEAYGYKPYKMSKFEEYDLYVRNKSFLVSDHVITFTDTDGKLMALKPDVTLSIVKNSREEQGVRRVFYNENVYRVPKGAFSFKEIMQSGIECIGNIDAYCVLEVLRLAKESLATISEDFVLDISHMGIISSLLDAMSLSREGREQMLLCIGEKNLHGIDSVCLSEGVDGAETERLKRLIASPLSANEMISILSGSNCESDAASLASVFELLSGCDGKVRIDFSVTGDMRYYNGIVCKGFLKGVPTSVLSGGQYDNLMKKMGKKEGAIGFAVYLDLIDELEDDGEKYDADVAVVYGDNTPISVIDKAVSEIRAGGETVSAVKSVSEKRKYKRIVTLD